MVHHDIWNYDTSTSPVLVDVTQNGQRVPAVVQVGKQAFAYAFNRVTGEPLWPIEERPVPAGVIPGEKLSPTQPFPTRPAPFDGQGLTHDDLVDYTPELRAEAIAKLEQFTIGPLFHPPLHRDNNLGKVAGLWCPGDVGGVNIDGPAAADPATGVLYVTSRRACSSRVMVPGAERDQDVIESGHVPTGSTLVDWAAATEGGPRASGPQGLPLFKPPYSRITAIDMNTGEHLWMIPVGETPDRYRENPALAGIDIGNTGSGDVAPMIVTPSMLMYTAEGADGTPFLYGVDKQTGASLGKVELPELPGYGMMTYAHDGEQYVVMQITGGLFAVKLPTPAQAN
jgi:quinoprotein glucose dehydrogenase